MTPADTEATNLTGSTACLEAVTLVLNNPGCTIGELVARLKPGLDDQQHDRVRLSLLPALQEGVERGHLVNGLRRECRERALRTTTWMPGTAFDRPLRPARGLRGLVCKAVLAVQEAQR